jgi:hypothetical protein
VQYHNPLIAKMFLRLKKPLAGSSLNYMVDKNTLDKSFLEIWQESVPLEHKHNIKRALLLEKLMSYS